MKRKLMILLLVLVACGPPDPVPATWTVLQGNWNSKVLYGEIVVPDGRTIPCLVIPGVGLSCDWSAR